MYCATVLARRLDDDILPHICVCISSNVKSVVQHLAVAYRLLSAGRNGWVHLAARCGVMRTSVVRCKSHLRCRQINCLSLVKLMSHSTNLNTTS